MPQNFEQHLESGGKIRDTTWENATLEAKHENFWKVHRNIFKMYLILIALNVFQKLGKIQSIIYVMSQSQISEKLIFVPSNEYRGNQPPNYVTFSCLVSHLISQLYILKITNIYKTGQ